MGLQGFLPCVWVHLGFEETLIVSGLKSPRVFVNLHICLKRFCLGFKNPSLKFRYQNIQYGDANNLKSSLERQIFFQ